MKILIVTPGYWPENFRVNDLASELLALGHDVEVLAGMPHYPEGKRAYPGYGWGGPWVQVSHGIRIFRFPILGRGKGGGLSMALHYIAWVVGAVLRLLMARPWRWDVVFVFQISPVTAALPALLARRLSGARSVIWVQDIWPEAVQSSGLTSHSLVIKPLRWVSDWIYRSFDRVIVQSRAFHAALAARGVPPERLECVFNWAEELFQGNPAPAPLTSWEWRKDAFVLMFAGTIGRGQGVSTLLEAATLLGHRVDIQWAIVGDGSQRGWLEAGVLERGLAGNVHFLGRLPLAEMPGLFAQADAMLLSFNRGDAYSMTVPGRLQSFLAAGKPVIGSSDGEAAEVIETSGAGWAVPAEDPEALAELILRMTRTSQEDRKKMGLAGQAYYRIHFQRENCIRAIESALGGAPATTGGARMPSA